MCAHQGSILPQAFPDKGSRKGSQSFSSTAFREMKKEWLAALRGSICIFPRSALLWSASASQVSIPSLVSCSRQVFLHTFICLHHSGLNTGIRSFNTIKGMFWRMGLWMLCPSHCTLHT